MDTNNKTSDSLRLRLLPLGVEVTLRAGESLQDVLFDLGVEFPCGGHGRCRGCRIKYLEGQPEVTAAEAALLNSEDLSGGWRLACCSRPIRDARIELAQWEAAILADDTPLTIAPREGLGVAIDVGTTTLVAQLVDLRNGQVLGVRTELNAQARHGADIMSRLEFATQDDGADGLARIIRRQLADMIQRLLTNARQESASLRGVVMVGNTAMHHLIAKIGVAPLTVYPFESDALGLLEFKPSDLEWDLPGVVRIAFLPCLGGFVGSDLLGGILATRLHENDSLQALIDLGTNGEIVLAHRDRLLCASTAAGPAFEGARISMGMRAATGAISEVTLRDGALHCHVLGGGNPRGLCGSGLVDAVSVGLELGKIQSSGKMTENGDWILQAPVRISQGDVRELQLAKGAIAAGSRVLGRLFGASHREVAHVFLAGAFGNYINRQSARRIGLLDFPLDRIQPAGNTALIGAKIALLGGAGVDLNFPEITGRVEHVSLSSDPEFQDIFIDEMAFPQS